MRVTLVKEGTEANGADVLARVTKSGDRYVQEDSVLRAAKKLGCKVGQLRLHPASALAIGAEKLNIITNGKSRYPLYGVIGVQTIYIVNGKEAE